jgi:phosphomannomutase
MTLSEVASEIPQSQVIKKDISCLPELKGKVIRTLSEELKDEDVELIDGIKIIYGDAWVHILPHPLRPVIELYAEAPKQKDAERLLKDYTTKIDDIIS